MKVETTSPVSIKLDVSMRSRINNLACIRKKTSHWLMLEAIEEYVEREEKRELLRRDVLNAWKAYESSGLHVTSKEAEAWFYDLEQGKDTDPIGLKNHWLTYNVCIDFWLQETSMQQCMRLKP